VGGFPRGGSSPLRRIRLESPAPAGLSCSRASPLTRPRNNPDEVSGHHIVPRFHLARWADASGQLDVVDLHALEARREDPKTFNAIPNFNRMETAKGQPDMWLEHEFLAGLDTSVANMRSQIENVPGPRSMVKVKKHRPAWAFNHFMSKKNTVGLAMYVAAQCVRSPAWREMVKLHTADAMKDFIETKVRHDLEHTQDPAERRRLEEMFGLRCMVADISGNTIPHLSGHLAYRLGEVLFTEYFWGVLRFPRAVLVLGDDPVMFLNQGEATRSGSFSQVADAAGRTFSVYREIEPMVLETVEIMRGHDMILLPIDPARMLVLSKFEHLMFPASYDTDVSRAKTFNTLMERASRRWLAMPPGYDGAAQRFLETRHPWIARQRERQ
jgi:hypothetical protein